MSARSALRVGVAGATGMLGSELLVALEETGFPIDELLPIASAESVGGEIELRDECWRIAGDDASLRDLDLLVLCAPAPVSLELARRALHAQVPVLDLSGALAGLRDVPLVVAGDDLRAESLRAPIVAAPGVIALPLALVLGPIAKRAKLSRIVATALTSASAAGRAGVEALSAESIALFNQQDAPEAVLADVPRAFDCIPATGPEEEHGETESEVRVGRSLHRLLGDEVGLALSMLRVPTFVGDGATLLITTREAITPDEARRALASAPAIELCEGDDPRAATTRTAAGRDVVLVGRVRRDPSCEQGLQLWLAADGVRLAAVHGARIAAAWLAAR